MTGIEKQVRFNPRLDYIDFDIVIESSPTMTFLQRAKKENFMGTEDVFFNDQKTKTKKEKFQSYVSAWLESSKALQNVIEIDNLILQSLIDNENNRDILGETLFNRFLDVKEAFPKYVALCFLNSFFSDIRKSVGVALRDKSWKTISSTLKLMETEFYTFKDYDFDVEILEEENTVDVSESFYNQVLDDARQNVMRHQDKDMSIEEIHSTRRRWKDYFSFLMNPIREYMEEKAKYVDLYFSIFDTGIKLSLINEVYLNNVPLAKYFINWEVPVYMLLEQPFRILFPPLVCADREFSCNHTAPEKTAFPTFATIEDVKAMVDDDISKFSCSQHPGKLLLLLIRMNLSNMVSFAIRNGLSVNLQADTGHCQSLSWKNEEGNFEHVQQVPGSKTRRELLDRQFSFETPLSVAVETAAYGETTEIVDKLLRQGANPLLCSDIAVKRAVNAVSLLATQRLKSENRDLKEQSILLKSNEKQRERRNKVVNIERGRYVKVPKPATNHTSTNASSNKRIHSGSTGSSETGSSGARKKRKRNFAKKKDRYKKEKFVVARAKNKRMEEDEQYDLSNPEKVSLFNVVPSIPILRNSNINQGYVPKGISGSVARIRASKTLRKILRTSDNYKKIKKNHFTKVLLYQACLEGREDAVKVILQSNNIPKIGAESEKVVKPELDDDMSLLTWKEESDMPIKLNDKKIVVNQENFEIIIHVIDTFLNDGLKKVYPNYTSVLNPIYELMQNYKLYPNNWRFVQLFHILKLSMKENLAGDHTIILKFVQLPQLKHFLKLETNVFWERVRFENIIYCKTKRTELKIEAPTFNPEMLCTDDDILFEYIRKKNIYGQSNPNLEKLFKYATKMESLEIIKALVDSGVTPLEKTADHMMAIAVKYQNTDLVQYIYQKLNTRITLTKACIISLKGKYHHAMDAIFRLGFSILPEKQKPIKIKSLSTTTTLSISSLKKVKKQSSLTDGRLRQILTLFTSAIQDVLFERTIFDKDDGRRHKYGFTRQDEEETFYLLIDFLLSNVPKKHLQRIVKKILARSRDEYDCRIWFFGFHNLLVGVINADFYDLLDDDFVEIYKLNYGQWLMYVKEQEAKFRTKRAKAIRERTRSRNRIRRNRILLDNSESEYSPIDTEAFLTMADGKVRRTLRRIFKRNNERVHFLRDQVSEVKELVRCTTGSEKTPHDPVRKECRRSGSRNNDFISLNNLLNGSSIIL